jgi:hypothetical protein
MIEPEEMYQERKGRKKLCTEERKKERRKGEREERRSSRDPTTADMRAANLSKEEKKRRGEETMRMKAKYVSPPSTDKGPRASSSSLGKPAMVGKGGRLMMMSVGGPLLPLDPLFLDTDSVSEPPLPPDDDGGRLASAHGGSREGEGNVVPILRVGVLEERRVEEIDIGFGLDRAGGGGEGSVVVKGRGVGGSGGESGGCVVDVERGGMRVVV